MKKELSKIIVLNDMLNRVCAQAQDKVYGLYCGLIHQAIMPTLKAYSDQVRAGKSDAMQRYEVAYSEWLKMREGQQMTPELQAEINAMRADYGVVEELVEAELTAHKLGEVEVEVVIPQMPVHVIPLNTAAGIIINFMNSGCLSVEAATEFLDKLAAKEAKKDEDKKGPGKPKKSK
jgi:hypothetical protein